MRIFTLQTKKAKQQWDAQHAQITVEVECLPAVTTMEVVKQADAIS